MVDTASKPTFEDNLEGKRIISCPSPSPPLNSALPLSYPVRVRLPAPLNSKDERSGFNRGGAKAGRRKEVKGF